MKKLFRYGLLVLGILFALSAAGVWYLSSRDVGAAYIAKTAKELAQDRFGADLAIGDISGNPVRGFSAGSLVLSKSGETIIAVDTTQVKLDLFSLLKGSPKIRSVTLTRADVRLEGLTKLSQGPVAAPTGDLPLFSLHFEDSTLRTKAGDFLFDDGTISLESKGLAVDSAISFNEVSARTKAEFRFAEGNLHLVNLDLRIGDGRVNLAGDVYPEIDVGGTLTDLDMETLSRFWPELGEKAFSGSISTNIKISGVWPDVGARGEIAVDDGSIYGIFLAGVRSSWWYRGDKLWFEEISGVANGSRISGTAGLVFRDSPPEIHLDLDATGVNLGTWEKTFPWLSIAEGTLETLSVDLSLTDGMFTGPAKFTSSSMKIASQPLEKVEATLELLDTGKIKTRASALWLGAPAQASGTISTGKDPSYDLTVDVKGVALHRASQVFPTEGLVLQGNAAGKVRIFGSGQKTRYEGELWSEKIRVMEEVLESPRLTFRYEDSKVELKGFSANWRGLPVRGSGMVAKPGSEEASLNVSGSTGEVVASALAHFLPGLSPEALTGHVTVSWKLSGPLKAPSLSMDLDSPGLTAFGKTSLSGFDASVTVPLPFRKGASTIKAKAGATSVGYEDFALTDVSATVSTDADVLRVDEFTGTVLSGTVEASGTIGLGSNQGNSPEINLTGSLSGADLSAFSTQERPVSGTLSGSFTATGSVLQPDISFSASVPELSALGYAAGDVTLSGIVLPGSVKIEKLSARIGDGTLDGDGTLSFGDDGSVTGFSITGTGLDLEYLTRDLPAARKAGVEGTLDVKLDGSLGSDMWSGSGEVFAEALSAYGITVRDVYAPVRIEGNVAKMENAQGDFYGGDLSADATATLGTSLWTVNAKISGFDIAGVTGDAFDLKGKITGTGEMKLSLEHGESRAMPLRGQGRFTAVDGEISGFEAVRALTSAYGGTGIRYSSADSSFTIGGNMIGLMPGSRMTSPPGDPLYRYMSVDGMLGFSSQLDLYCSGNVNVQALSTFFGAFEGLLSSESLDPQRMLENMLGGFLGGMSKKDFRDVSFNIAGSWEKPQISNVKIAVPERNSAPTPSGGDPERQTDQRKIEIEIPTGGGSSNGDSVGGQIKQQILEQIFTTGN
jgi:translocation and assembly module TamB